jgi:general secretion pathway protein A
MYNTFFGFREKPFKLVPNPDYLYLSKSHEDALAHLAYAVDQGDGFVVIIGEVGTGKTTLCRNFLEQLDSDTESAYIFNPRLDSTQLMSSICNEYGIKTSGRQDIKELLDKLNTYLIAQHRLDRKVVLLIDEAQGLSIESLEMVRLISNLETTRSKLLQIILVGQPELEQKLASHELRQLAQRISLNCQLKPLTASETDGYIRHRVNIAAVRPSEVFTTGACQKAYEYSGGVPRLINIICDRALLAAYSSNQSTIHGSLVQAVAAELDRRGHEIRPRSFPWRALWLAIAIVLLFAVSFWGIRSGILTRLMPGGASSRHDRNATQGIPQVRAYKVPAQPVEPPSEPEVAAQPVERPPEPEVAKQPVEPPSEPEVATQSAETSTVLEPDVAAANDAPQPAVESPPVRPVPQIQNFTTMSRHASRLRATALIFGMWQRPKPAPEQYPPDLPDADFFKISAFRNGLRVYVIENDWELIQRINLPAIVGVKQPGTDSKIYLALIGWDGQQVRLTGDQPDRMVAVDFDQLRAILDGPIYIVWKNTLGYDFIIGQGAKPEALLKVKKLLMRIGYEDILPTPVYDPPLHRSILDFQARHQINTDGLVGPLTKILLIREAGGIDVPLLNQHRRDGV